MKKFIKRLCSRTKHGLLWCRNASRRCVYGGVKAVVTHKLRRLDIQKIDLCCGNERVPGYFGIDFCGDPDLKLDLAKYDLPFKSNSLTAVICISAINYFKRARAEDLVGEVYRVLKVGGGVRFGVQDMESIARRYVEKDEAFFFQKLPSGEDRFEGPTLGDKFAAWFYGYAIKRVPCQYFYDYESLAHMFKTAGFSVVERKAFQDSSLENIHMIDNRPDQMFFLEAVK